MKLFFTRYYCVIKNETAVCCVRTNTLKPYNLPAAGNKYYLLPEQERYLGYISLVVALQKAKAGALAYINWLNHQGAAAATLVKQYRINHYEDLNVNLISDNICRVEAALKVNPLYEWHPYRIPAKIYREGTDIYPVAA